MGALDEVLDRYVPPRSNMHLDRSSNFDPVPVKRVLPAKRYPVLKLGNFLNYPILKFTKFTKVTASDWCNVIGFFRTSDA